MKSLILTFVFLSSLNAVAQNQTSTTSTELSTVQPAITDNISVSLDLSQSFNQFSEEQAEAVRSTAFSARLSKKLASENKLSLSISAAHKATGYNDTSLADTSVSYSLKAKELNRDNSVTYSFKAIFPTSDASQEARLRGAAALNAALTSKKQLVGKPLALAAHIDGLKYSHKYSLSAEGEGLMNYRIRLGASASIDISTKINFGVSGYYQAGETYQNALKATFLLSEELSFTPKKDGASFYLAHANNGDALDPNGENSNIKAYDSKSSVYSAGVRATF